MEEVQKETESKSEVFSATRPFNLRLAVGILAVVVVVGLVLGFSSINKSPKGVSTQVSKPTTQSGKSTSQEVNKIEVEGGNFYFKPNEIKVKKGDKVKIVLTNKDSVHDFIIDEFGVATNRTPEGKTDSVEFIAEKSGTFEFYCSVANHREMGMKGKLIVE